MQRNNLIDKFRYAILLILVLASGRVLGQRNSPDTIACPLENGKVRLFFNRMDIPAEFQGGYFQWVRFAQQQFDFQYVLKKLPDTLQKFYDSITVIFAITRDGQLCHLHMLNGNPVLLEPTVRLLKRSRWIPGSSEGRLLNTFRTLRITISVDRQAKTFVFDRRRENYELPND